VSIAKLSLLRSLLIWATADYDDTPSPIERVFVLRECRHNRGVGDHDHTRHHLRGPFPNRRHCVTEYPPPHAVSFHQEAWSPRDRATVDIHYRLTPRLLGVLALLSPVIMRSIGAERILARWP
jgi:hypothetical protein